MTEASLAAPLADHRDAVASTLATAGAIASDRWNVPIAEGKWSPGEIAEHLRLTYAIINQEIATGNGLRVKTRTFQRLILRIFMLPKILRTGRIPGGARAAKEIRPGGGPFDQSATLRALEEEARRFESAIGSRPGVTITHHVFGTATAPVAIRFLGVHTRHHEAQLKQL